MEIAMKYMASLLGTFVLLLALFGCGSDPAPTPLPPVPAKPAGLQLTGGDGQVTVSWTPSAGATSYNIYYGTSAGVTTSSLTKAIGVTAPPQVVSSLTNGTPYFFVVTAVNPGGESGLSTEKTATPAAAPQPPGSPTGVTVTSPASGQVHIVWNSVVGATSYNVYYLASPAATITNAEVLAGTVANTATASLDLSLTGGTKYWFLVKAANAAGESGTQNSAKNITVTP